MLNIFSDFYCSGRPDGNYDRVDDLCQSYLQCSNFSTKVVQCAGSTRWYDDVRKQCVGGPAPPFAQKCKRT